MCPGKFTVGTSERRKRFYESNVVAGDVVGREAESLMNQPWSRKRRHSDQNHYDQTKNSKFVFQKPAPRISPERPPLYHFIAFSPANVGFGHSHLWSHSDDIRIRSFLSRNA